MKLKLFKIYFLFLLFFIIDKLLLIQQVRLAISESSASNPFIETLDNIKPDIQTNKKNYFWNFGTSRSFGFVKLPVDAHTQIDEFLGSNAKEKLLEWEGSTFSAPGSNLSIYYRRFRQLLDMGYTPSAVFIEISPFSFNFNNRYNGISRIEAIPINFMLKYHFDFPISYKKDILYSRLFASYRYKISFKRAGNFILPKKKLSKQEQMLEDMKTNALGGDMFLRALEAVKNKPNKVYTDPEFGDYHNDSIDAFSKSIKFDLLSNILDKEFLNQYTIDPDQFHFLENILKVAKQQKISVVLWQPKVHESLHKVRSKYKLEQIWEPKILELSKKYNVKYINFNNPSSLKCNYFADASHLSFRCFSEMAYRLVESSN